MTQSSTVHFKAQPHLISQAPPGKWRLFCIKPKSTAWHGSAPGTGTRAQAQEAPWASGQLPAPPRATHLPEALLEVPKLQALLQFLLMLCPELIEGSLGFVQLGQEPGREEELTVCVAQGAPHNVEHSGSSSDPKAHSTPGLPEILACTHSLHPNLGSTDAGTQGVSKGGRPWRKHQGLCAFLPASLPLGHCDEAPLPSLFISFLFLKI